MSRCLFLLPPQLWHGVLFYTAGELTTREHWTPRLDGKRSVADSLSALVASFK